MENGYVILGIVGLLFLSMYGFAYSSVILEKNKERKAKRIEFEKEQLRLKEKAEKQKIREEKIGQLNKRSQEIKLELEKLEQRKKEQEVKKLKIS
jgi:Flp pilus assembly protein TadB